MILAADNPFAVRFRLTRLIARRSSSAHACLVIWLAVYVAGSSLFAIGLVAGAAVADSDGQWIPSFTFHTGVNGLNYNAGVDSLERGHAEGDGRLVFPYIEFGLELMSPVLTDGFLAPRLFVHAGPEIVFDLERAVAKEGDPGGITIFSVDPDGPGGPAPPIFPGEDRVIGVGSEALVKALPFAWSAGLGIAFSFPVLERTLFLKPSIEYRYDQLEVTAALANARSMDGDGFCPCRTVSISARDSWDFHAVGPAIELEVEAVRVRSFLLTVFGSARGYYILGDRSLNVRASGRFDDGVPASVSATVNRSPWSFRGGVGIRARWQPE